MLSTDKGDKMVEINMLKADNRIRRFHTGRIIEHWIALVTFIILVSTGLTQKFYPLDISQWFIMKSGGIDNVRLIHRYAGIIFSLAAIVHIITGIIGVVFKGWQPSMIITSAWKTILPGATVTITNKNLNTGVLLSAGF